MIGAPARVAWYVYGVASATDLPAETGWAGVDTLAGDRSLELVRGGALVAIASPVDAAEFSEEALQSSLNDPERLEQRARTHDTVLRHVSDRATVVPLRFGAVYHDVAAVREMLTAREEELSQRLGELRGRCELGVTIWIDRVSTTTDTEETVPASGRAYLERLKADRERRGLDAERARNLVRDVYRRLHRISVDGVANRPQPRELTGRVDEMILNAAYLVDRADVGRFAEAVTAIGDEVAEAGARIELSGPWPPYNFVGHQAESA